MKPVKDYVEKVLNEDDKTRNNYNWLVIQTLRKMGLNIEVDEEILLTMPSIETITRECREIQNAENRLMPNQRTRERRDRKEKGYKETFKRNKLTSETFPNSHLSW
jgi:hypothetical protein